MTNKICARCGDEVIKQINYEGVLHGFKCRTCKKMVFVTGRK